VTVRPTVDSTDAGPASHVLYRLDASIRVEGSHSRAIADLVEQESRSAHPEEPIIRRHIGVDPIPATAWATAVFAGRTPEESRGDEGHAAMALAATLTDELVSADALLFAVPLYNFGVSQHFKAWVDMVIADPRMAAGAEPILAGKPAILVTVRGGSYRPGTPREGWDHATGWMQRILADVWKPDLKTVEAEFTLVGINPALDQFKDLADQLRKGAEEEARRSGRRLSAAVASASPDRQAA
jgi:FMN-dependent NADH-azoreductase